MCLFLYLGFPKSWPGDHLWKLLSGDVRFVSLGVRNIILTLSRFTEWQIWVLTTQNHILPNPFYDELYLRKFNEVRFEFHTTKLNSSDKYSWRVDTKYKINGNEYIWGWNMWSDRWLRPLNNSCLSQISTAFELWN